MGSEHLLFVLSECPDRDQDFAAMGAVQICKKMVSSQTVQN